VSAQQTKKLIIEADELGLTESFNQGILQAHKEGILQSACLRTNGSAFYNAVNYVIPECTNLGIGLHLNLVEGFGDPKYIPNRSSIYNISGEYKNNFLSLLARCQANDKKLLHEIKQDYRIQIEKALEAGVTLDHVNSHQHSHIIPKIFHIVCELAIEYNIPYVRLPKEIYYRSGGFPRYTSTWYLLNLVKLTMVNLFSKRNKATALTTGVNTNDYFIGVTYTGHMNLSTVENGLAKLDKLNPEVVEMLLHPCRFLPRKRDVYITPDVESYVLDIERQNELSTLLDSRLPNIIESNGWTLTNFRNISNSSDVSYE